MAEYNLNDPTSPLNTQYNDQGEPQSAYDMVKESSEYCKKYALNALMMPKDGKEIVPDFNSIISDDGSISFIYDYNLSKRIGIKSSERDRLVFYNPNDENNICLRYTFPFLYYSNNDSDYTKGISEYAPPDCILHSSMKIDDMINQNVPLLSFDRIQNIFRKYIVMNANFSSYYEQEKSAENRAFEMSRIEINEVKLGYTKIKERNTGKSLLLPVWMFYRCQYYHYSNSDGADYMLNENNDRFADTPAGFTFLCINAIDGSIIDLSQGY